MTLRKYLFAIVFCTLICGLGVAGYFRYSATVLERLQYKATDSSLMLREFDRIGEHLDLLLISADLTIGTGESYTGQIALEQLQVMRNRLAAFQSDNSAELETHAFLRMIELLGMIDMQLRSQSSLATANNTINNKILVEFDNASAELVLIYDELRKFLIEGTQALKIESEKGSKQAMISGVLVIMLYVLASLCLALWLGRKIARPLEALSLSADNAWRKGAVFEAPIEVSVVEISKLSINLASLISRLEIMVDARTKDLSDKTHSLELQIEERIAIQAELEEARKLAEKSNMVKSEFLSVMSHELRTPLNAILGTLQILRDNGLTKIQEQYIDMADNSGAALLSLLGNVLDLSKIETDGITLVEDTFHLHPVLESTLDMIRSPAQKKGLELSLQILPDVPDLLMGDFNKLRQIIMNLVSNAIKFTDAGSIMIRVCRSADENAPDKLLFEVIDSGIGIPDESQEAIFGKFTQINSSLSRSHSGVGLGLAICSRLIEALGGDYGVNSKEGHGSTFWFTAILPQQKTSQHNKVVPFSKKLDTDSQHGHVDAISNEHQMKTVGPSKGSVLIVEDSKVNQMIASAIIERAGYEIEVADDGYQALNILSSRRFDVILLDIQLPGIDGIEVTRKIRSSHKWFSDVRIIACSANVLDSTIKSCQEAGIDDFTTKPIVAKELLKKLSQP